MSIEYLEVKGGDTRYIYTTGRIRGLEKYLLKETDFSRIKESKGLVEALEILSKIFPYSESFKKIEEKNFERILEEELKRTHREIRSFCPQPELVDLFWIEYDFHNLKVLLKAHFQENLSLGYTPQLKVSFSPAGTLNIEILKEAVQKEDFTTLSPQLKSLLEEIFPSIKENPQPHTLDTLIDKLFFRWIYQRLSNYNDPFITQLIKKEIDSFNIMTFFRIRFLKRDDEEKLLKEALIEGGETDKEIWIKLSHQPKESIERELGSTGYIEIIKQVLEGKKEREESLFSLDKFFDEYILKYSKKGFYVSFGREALINYILLKKQEIKRLRTILREKINQTLMEEERVLTI
ncbi:V-type ATPase subunit [Candidatus Aerophobetes bacterium]|nr:V-type ATPase subunit [Candidatus Aerophobetes bacterium]